MVHVAGTYLTDGSSIKNSAYLPAGFMVIPIQVRHQLAGGHQLELVIKWQLPFFDALLSVECFEV